MNKQLVLSTLMVPAGILLTIDRLLGQSPWWALLWASVTIGHIYIIRREIRRRHP